MASFRRQSVANTNPELHDPALFTKDSRTFWMRFKSDFNRLFPMLIVLCGLALLYVPEHGDFIFAFAIGIRLFNTRSDYEFPFEAPEWSEHICRESLRETVKNGHLIPQRKIGIGTLIFGIEYLRNRLLVSNADMETRHSLVLGSTGSGKTVLILTLLFQALLQPGGTSAVVVDGKADIGLFWIIFAILKRLDRLNDLLVLNFLTPLDCLDTRNMHDEDRISNNMNILNKGTPDQMKTITMGLGRESEGGDSSFWEGRSSTMMGASYQYLVYERDVEGLDLNIEVVRDFLVLKTMIKAASRRDVHIKHRRPLQQYLKTLPGIVEPMFRMSEQEIDKLEVYQKAEEQHTYNIMMVSETMSDLTDTMSHIFVTKLSEVNMTDVCLGGRVLLVLLPSIAKNQDAVAALGRLLLQGLRPILMRAAGYKLQGDRITTVDNRPSSAKYPVRLFLDEYGMYGVKGFFIIVSLVRSYGFHVLFGAQTAGMFQRVCGREEYEALIGNLNNKFILKNEDHGESLNLAMGRTGKVFTARQDKIESGTHGAHHDRENVRLEQQEMVTSRMMASCEPGEGLYIYGGEVYPFKVMKLDFPQVETAKLNHFAQVLDPTVEEVEDAKRQCLLQSSEYIKQANEYATNEIEFIESKELASNLARIKELDITDNISKQVMLSIGLSFLEREQENSEDEPDINDSEIDSFDDNNRIEDESYVNDAELQIMEAHDAYLENFDEDQGIDYSDYEAYADSWGEEHPTEEEVVSNSPATVTDDDQDELDLTVFEGSPFEDIEGQYKQRYVSSNLSAEALQSAIDNGQAEIGESLNDLLQGQGKSEVEAIKGAQSAVKRINEVLAYPNTNVHSQPMNTSEVDQLVSQTLQSLGSRF